MHPLQHPRNAALVGILFIAISIAFWGLAALLEWHIDWAGVTMLGALGIAMALMAYVLVAGSPNE